MRPVTEKVIQRLAHENLLIPKNIRPRRRQITLEDILEAGKEEPRIYEVLPAVLLYKPTMIKGLYKDLKRYPQIEDFAKHLFVNVKEKNNLFGIDKEECVKAALTFKQYLDRKRISQKSRTMTLRLAVEDIERLKKLTQIIKTRSVSETIRFLAREKHKMIDKGTSIWSIAH